jgi:hypothetical protein
MRRWITCCACIFYLGSYIYVNPMYLYGLIAPEKVERKLLETYSEKTRNQEEFTIELKTTVGQIGGVQTLLAQDFPEALQEKFNALRIEGWFKVNRKKEHIDFHINIVLSESEMTLVKCSGMSTNTALFLKNGNNNSSQWIKIEVGNQGLLQWFDEELEKLSQGVQSDIELLLDQNYSLEGLVINMNKFNPENTYFGMEKQGKVKDEKKVHSEITKNERITCVFYFSDKKISPIYVDVEDAIRVEAQNWEDIITKCLEF